MILVSECGGAAATSFMKMLPEEDKKNIYLYDQDHKVKDLYGKLWGINPRSKPPQFIAPTAEYPEQWVSSPQYNPAATGACVKPGDLSWIHNKRSLGLLLSERQFKLNKRKSGVLVPTPVVDQLFMRPERGAGSRGAEKTHEDVYVCEYVPLTSEWVVDFNTATGTFYPREVLLMKNGADVIVKVYPEKDPKWQAVVHAARSIIETLGITQAMIGNIQLGEQNNKANPFVFIEMALRLSGSSSVCLQFGGNVLTGEPMDVPSETLINLR